MKLKPPLKKITMALGLSTAVMCFPVSAANLPTPYIHSLAPLSEVSKSVSGLVDINLGEAQLAAYYGTPADPKKVELIQKLVEAGKLMDNLYLKQLNTNNIITDNNGVVTGGILPDLQNTQYNIDPAYLKLFKINLSQWDAGNGYEPFINIDEPLPDGIELYPRGLSATDWEDYVAGLSDADADRAAAFRDGSDNTHIYVASDKDWVDLDGDVEITIGPYEQYLDSIAGIKAMFMTMTGIKDPVALKIR